MKGGGIGDGVKGTLHWPRVQVSHSVSRRILVGGHVAPGPSTVQGYQIAANVTLALG